MNTLRTPPAPRRSPTSPIFAPTRLIGPYRLLRELGVGGMGSVCWPSAADGSLKRQVALKLPRASWSRAWPSAWRASATSWPPSNIRHIARLYDAGTDAQGRPFLALEYVEASRSTRTAAARRWACASASDCCVQVAQAWPSRTAGWWCTAT